MFLDERNYDLWAPFIQTHIRGRKKWIIFVGLSRLQKRTTPSTMIGSPQIKKKKELATVIHETEDYEMIYLFTHCKRNLGFVEDTLIQKVSNLRQNGHSLATYFGELTEIFQELEHFNKVAMECANDLKVYKNIKPGSDTTKRKWGYKKGRRNGKVLLNANISVIEPHYSPSSPVGTPLLLEDVMVVSNPFEALEFWEIVSDFDSQAMAYPDTSRWPNYILGKDIDVFPSQRFHYK